MIILPASRLAIWVGLLGMTVFGLNCRGADLDWISHAETASCCDEPALIDFGTGWDSQRPLGAECYWFRTEFLNWNLSGAELPALASTSTDGTPREDAGVLGNSVTSVVIGDQPITDGDQSGGRAALGFWLDDCHQIGFEYTYTGLGKLSESFQASSDTFGILARPFFNVASGSEDARVLGFPGEISGQIRVDYTTEYQAHEFLLLHPLSLNRNSAIYLVCGYRAADLDDALSISDSSRSLAGSTAGTLIESSDQFRTENEFQGFECGLVTKFQLTRRWRLDMDAKVAFGETDHLTVARGQTITTTSGGQSALSNSGLLVQSTNQGRFASSSNSVLHDFSISLRRHIRWGLSANIGYSAHRWTDVARAAEQVDRSINPTQIPPGTLVGPARPKPMNSTNDFIAQGLTAGLEWVW